MTHRRVAYLHSNALIAAGDCLPANEGRASLVHDLISSLALLDDGEPADDAQVDAPRATIVEPRVATRAELTRFHDTKYIDALLGKDDASDESNSREDSDASSSSDEPTPTFGLSRSSSSSQPPRKRHKPSSSGDLGLQDDCPLFPSLAAYTTLVAGASMTAARLLRDREADVAVSWNGGRHHGKRGEASGFCYVNDIVLAIMELRTAPKPPRPPPSPSPPPNLDPAASPPPAPPAPPPLKRLNRILYVDLDLHHGDGVESAFFSTPSVLTLSLHLHAPLFFPSSGALDSTGPLNPKAPGAGHALNVTLEPGAGEETLERVWASCVEEVRAVYQPDAVVLQCGVDGLAGDPCKEWNLSLSSLGACVARALDWGLPTLLLGGGGYNHPNAARAWAYLTSIALSRPLPLSTPIPPALPPPSYALFAPSFTLDVPASPGPRDRNTPESLRVVERVVGGVVERLGEKYGTREKATKKEKKKVSWALEL